MASETLYEDSQGVFLDLSSCGSSIRWGVVVKKITYKREGEEKTYYNFSGNVSLTDCHRAISWEGGHQRMLKKINVAIRSLQALRQSIKQAIKVMPKDKQEEDDDD